MRQDGKISTREISLGTHGSFKAVTSRAPRRESCNPIRSSRATKSFYNLLASLLIRTHSARYLSRPWNCFKGPRISALIYDRRRNRRAGKPRARARRETIVGCAWPARNCSIACAVSRGLASAGKKRTCKRAHAGKTRSRCADNDDDTRVARPFDRSLAEPKPQSRAGAAIRQPLRPLQLLQSEVAVDRVHVRIGERRSERG